MSSRAACLFHSFIHFDGKIIQFSFIRIQLQHFTILCVWIHINIVLEIVSLILHLSTCVLWISFSPFISTGIVLFLLQNVACYRYWNIDDVFLSVKWECVPWRMIFCGLRWNNIIFWLQLNASGGICCSCNISVKLSNEARKFHPAVDKNLKNEDYTQLC